MHPILLHPCIFLPSSPILACPRHPLILNWLKKFGPVPAEGYGGVSWRFPQPPKPSQNTSCAVLPLLAE